MQTRKHFIQTAQTVAKIENDAVRYQTALEFAHTFRKENPRFDTFRFMAACNASVGNRPDGVTGWRTLS